MKIILLLCFSINAFARLETERPTRPMPGVDQDMVKAIQDRLTAGLKKDELAKAVQSYREGRVALQNKRTSGASPKQIDTFGENLLQSEREKELRLVEDFGPCKTHPVSYQKQEDTNFNRHWYTSNGFCVFNSEKGEAFNSVYDRLKQHLNTPVRYPKRLDGFNFVLEYLLVDASGKALSTQQTPVKGAEFDAFIAIPSPLNLVALSYFFHARTSEKQMGDVREFQLLFDSLEKQPPTRHPVYYGASGTGDESAQNPIRMRMVNGGWYLRWDARAREGVMQYFTQADFSLPMFGAEAFARRVLLDTILTLYERARDVEGQE